MASLRFGRLIMNASAAHVSLSLASICLGYYGGSPDGKEAKEVVEAHHFRHVTKLVMNMYSGKGAYHPRCQLDQSVTFEDPAAICQSPKEVQEAFRALRALQPKSLSTPKCIHVEPSGSSIVLKYALHQRYHLLSLDLKSHLIVEVELNQMRDFTESEFLVTRFEECWNGISPNNNYALWITRRINGILSWYVTRKLIPE